mmetsp:Transcript_123199/g.213645  ORF Transcript_123199/g.213645 Transcript_123199/m.213645 type:complete len:176 (+) Transcript_123199:95-622(+)
MLFVSIVLAYQVDYARGSKYEWTCRPELCNEQSPSVIKLPWAKNARSGNYIVALRHLISWAGPRGCTVSPAPQPHLRDVNWGQCLCLHPGPVDHPMDCVAAAKHISRNATGDKFFLHFFFSPVEWHPGDIRALQLYMNMNTTHAGNRICPAQSHRHLVNKPLTLPWHLSTSPQPC